MQDLSQYLQEPINLPGPFLQDSVLGFCQAVAELSKVLDEVEQVGWSWVLGTARFKRDRGWEANANGALGGGAALKWVEWV